MIHAALDTSLGFSLAVLDEHCQPILQANIHSAGRESDRMLLPWIVQQLQSVGLTPQSVEAWSVGVGPGSFAGLRCGIAAVLGIASISNAKVRGVSSAIGIAAAALKRAGDGAAKATQCTVLHDGRCNQVLAVPLKRSSSDSHDWQISAAASAVDGTALIHTQDMHWATMQPQAMPELTPQVSQQLLVAENLDATALALVPEAVVPWPTDPTAMAQSVEPIYVRQAVFVQPATLRKA